jgi:hypothetical protein
MRFDVKAPPGEAKVVHHIDIFLQRIEVRHEVGVAVVVVFAENPAEALGRLLGETRFLSVAASTRCHCHSLSHEAPDPLPDSSTGHSSARASFIQRWAISSSNTRLAESKVPCAKRRYCRARSRCSSTVNCEGDSNRLPRTLLASSLNALTANWFQKMTGPRPNCLGISAMLIGHRAPRRQNDYPDLPYQHGRHRTAGNAKARAVRLPELRRAIHAGAR